MSTSATTNEREEGLAFQPKVNASTQDATGVEALETGIKVLDLLTQASADAQLRGNGAVRESRDNAALRAAGIESGHPSLYEAS